MGHACVVRLLAVSGGMTGVCVCVACLVCFRLESCGLMVLVDGLDLGVVVNRRTAVHHL